MAQMIQFYFSNNGISFELVDQVLNYGCWCQIRNISDFKSGKGIPLDSFDQACKQWQQCSACNQMENADCNYFQTVYEIGFDPVSMRIACSSNPDSCSINKCTVSYVPCMSHNYESFSV